MLNVIQIQKNVHDQKQRNENIDNGYNLPDNEVRKRIIAIALLSPDHQKPSDDFQIACSFRHRRNCAFFDTRLAGH